MTPFATFSKRDLIDGELRVPSVPDDAAAL